MAERRGRAGRRRARVRVPQKTLRTPRNMWEHWPEQGDETSRERMNAEGMRFSSQGFILGFEI